MRDVIGDPEPTIDKAIDRTLSTMPSGHFRDEDRPHWVEDGPDGSARLRPEVLTIAERVSSRANHLLPPFISELGALSVTISPQSTWRDDIARSSVRFHFANGGGNAHFRMIGAGSRRWVAASLEAACDDLAIESTNASSLLYLIDEPEMHLHTLAQLEVLRWIEDRVAEGATAVLTTHSPLIFTTARESATLHALIRHGRDLTQVNMTESLLSDLGAIDGIADAVGTDRIAVLQVTRGLLAVEGEHDKMVIKRFFGPVLDRARIRLFPLRGHKNAMALAESELLTSLGIPLCVLFDDIREEALARRVEGSDLSGEEKEMIKLLDAMDRFRLQGLRIDGVPFSLPDVICAIPIQAIRRAFPRTRHDVAWDEVVAAWRGAARPRPGFKAFALKKLGLQNVEPDQFVERSLLAIQVVDRCASELEVAVKGSLAWLVGRPPGKS
jgi:hypothetical protein